MPVPKQELSQQFGLKQTRKSQAGFGYRARHLCNLLATDIERRFAAPNKFALKGATNFLGRIGGKNLQF
jgi:hypothetical protein